MQTVSKRALAVGVLAVACAVSAAAADMTIVAQVTLSKGAPSTQTTYMTADKMRLSDPGTDMILDFGSSLMTVIDNKKREFSQSTPEERDAFFAKIDAQMKQMQDQLANLPAAARKMMGGAMGGGQVAVKKTTETRKIAGYNTTKFLVTMGESFTMEQWITTELAPPTGYFDGLKSEWAKNPMLKNALGAIEEFKKIKGYPLADTTTFKGPMGMGGSMTREVTEVKLGPIPASTFDVPAGYKKKDSPFKMK